MIDPPWKTLARHDGLSKLYPELEITDHSDVSRQMNQTRICRRESARTVELTQVWLVIHMNPLHPTFAGHRDGTLD